VSIVPRLERANCLTSGETVVSCRLRVSIERAREAPR
jgi:hypothetical protein